MDDSPPPASLSADERAALFRGEPLSVDRAAALRAGPERVPRKVVLWMIATFFFLGAGGVLLEHYFSNSSLASSTPTTTLAGVGPTPSVPSTPQLRGPLNAFIGLEKLSGAPAPDLTLRTQSGRTWRLSAQRGRIVVLAFFNEGCNDVCPVVRDELTNAQNQLGPRAKSVEFVAINTDPFHTKINAHSGALDAPVPRGFVFLNGPLRTLNSTWANYGVTVSVGSTHSQLAHNDICYFIDTSGALRFHVTPFANEDAMGHYSLSTPQITRFATGLARVVSSLQER